MAENDQPYKGYSFRRVAQISIGESCAYFSNLFALNDTLLVILNYGTIHSLSLTDQHQSEWKKCAGWANLGLQLKKDVCKTISEVSRFGRSKDNKVFSQEFDTYKNTVFYRRVHKYPYYKLCTGKGFLVWSDGEIMTLENEYWRSSHEVIMYRLHEPVKYIQKWSIESRTDSLQLVNNDEIWISNGKHIIIFHVPSSTTTHIKDAHKQDIRNMILWKGRVVTAAGSSDTVIKVWLNKQVILELKHEFMLCVHAIAHREHILFTSDANERHSFVHIWNWNGDKLATIHNPHNFEVNSVCVWKEYIVTCGPDGFLILWKGKIEW